MLISDGHSQNKVAKLMKNQAKRVCGSFGISTLSRKIFIL